MAVTAISEDTIFALASGAGVTAIAVVRLSGPRSAALIETLCGRVPPPRRATLVSLVEPGTGDLLDRAIVLWFPGPATFTGGDSAELHLHGGRAVVAGVLEALAKLGCRPAEAGEFSRRAFRNGKIDLTELEGLADLVAAETRAQRSQALRQLGGSLGRRADTWRAQVLRASAMIEAEIDFSDEGDVAEVAVADVQAVLRPLRDEIAELLSREGRRGERLREGFTIVIAGPPNAGKSTLMNVLAQRDVAIVSPHAGTTRDAIEVHLDLEGLPIVLVDTAGIRDSDDLVEQEGVARARQRAAQADLVLWLQPLDEAAQEPAVEHVPVLLVATKVDRAEGAFRREGLAISAQTGQGMEDLLRRLADTAKDSLLGAENSLMTRARHRAALEEALQSLDRACRAPAGIFPELLAEDIRLAARALGRVVGAVDVEDVLGEIFTRFCIGK